MKIPNEKLISIANTIFKKKYNQPMYDYQIDIFKNKDVNRIINKSRQVGISNVLACQHLLDSIFNDTTEVVVSPSQRQSKHLLEYAYEFLTILRDDFNVPTTEETKTSIIFQGGGQFHSFPNSPSTIRGIRAHHITFDEYSHFICGTDKEMQEAILPSMSRGGTVTYNSTPFGDMNVYCRMWKDKEKYDLKRILINWRQCPDMTEEKIFQIRKEIGEDAFLQEFENKFLSDAEGQEFPLKLIEGCIDYNLEFNKDPALSFNKSSNYVGGVDIGRKHDLTALITLEKKEGIYQANYKRTMKDAEYDEQKNFMRYILNNARFDKFWVDASGIGSDIAETLKKEFHVSSLIFNNENKQELVTNLKNMMQQGKIKFPNDTQLINSIRAIQRQYTANNFIRFDSPRTEETGHADLFWSLALAVYKQSKKKGGFKLG